MLKKRIVTGKNEEIEQVTFYHKAKKPFLLIMNITLQYRLLVI